MDAGANPYLWKCINLSRQQSNMIRHEKFKQNYDIEQKIDVKMIEIISILRGYYP